MVIWALAKVAQLVGESSSTPKGHGFDSLSGHITRLQVQSPVGEHRRRRQPVNFSLSYQCFSIYLSIYLCVSLSLKAMKNVLRWRLKNGNMKNKERLRNYFRFKETKEIKTICNEWFRTGSWTRKKTAIKDIIGTIGKNFKKICWLNNYINVKFSNFVYCKCMSLLIGNIYWSIQG